MVDPEPVDQAPLDQVEHLLVGGGEDAAPLDAQADEGGDVEEAPVVELLAGRPPVAEAVVLAVDEGVEGVEVLVDGGHRPVDGPGQVEVLLQQPGQLAPEDLLVPVALDDALLVGGVGGRQAAEGDGQAGQLVGPEQLGRAPEEVVEGAGRHRHHVVEVADDEAAAVAVEAKVARLQHPPVVVAEEREEDLLAGGALGVPVDVEGGRPPAGRPVLQDVPPPDVGLADGHVVGDDVDDLAHPPPPERLGQPLVAGLAAQLDVEPGVVDHVVAVGAPRRRLEDGRQVDVAHAEVGQVVDDLGGVVEREPGVHLEAVRGQRR